MGSVELVFVNGKVVGGLHRQRARRGTDDGLGCALAVTFVRMTDDVPLSGLRNSVPGRCRLSPSSTRKRLRARRIPFGGDLFQSFNVVLQTPRGKGSQAIAACALAN